MAITNLKTRSTAHTTKPQLIYVESAGVFTSALVNKETAQGWLAQPRFKDERGHVQLASSERYWKRDVGVTVWLDLAQAKADTTQRLTRQVQYRQRQIAELQESLTLVAEYQPAALD